MLAEKLLFDIDYNWNVGNNSMDYSQLDRFSEVWSQSELDLIISQNAIDFYKLKNNKVKQKIF